MRCNAAKVDRKKDSQKERYMNTFNLRIVASNGVFYDGDCESLVIPAADGEFGIQANHEPMVIAIYIGTLRFKTDGEWHTVVTGQGYARTGGNRTVLIVDSAERPEDVDEHRAERAAERAKELLSVKTSEKNYFQGQLAMTRAMARLKAKKQLHNR